MDEFEISIIIPWANRNELTLTLPKNDAWFKNQPLEVLIVNCGGSQEMLDKLIDSCGLDYVRSVEVPTGTFNRSLALNFGIHASRSPVLMMFDADLILQTNFVKDALSLVDVNTFVTLEDLIESDKSYLPAPAEDKDSRSSVFLKELVKTSDIEFSWQDRAPTRVTTSRRRTMLGSRSGSGMLVARKADLLEINGYNSELRVWGWEDIDVLIRLERNLGLRRTECGSAIHLTHDDSQRAVKGDTRVNNDLENFLLVLSRYARDNFAGTYADDLANASTC